MGRMYTVDKKLLTETPEIRFGDQVFAVDDRVRTADKIAAIDGEKLGIGEYAKKILPLALGDKSKEIDIDNLSTSALKELIYMVSAAVNGMSEKEAKARFHGEE